MNGGGEATKITASTVIDRPVADVWRWYAVEHVRNHPRWDADMELEQISEGPIGLGTPNPATNSHFDEPIEGEMEIVEWKPERSEGPRCIWSTQPQSRRGSRARHAVRIGVQQRAQGGDVRATGRLLPGAPHEVR
jgi:hypothetical protein